jgi:hypothetical protein
MAAPVTVAPVFFFFFFFFFFIYIITKTLLFGCLANFS